MEKYRVTIKNIDIEDKYIVSVHNNLEEKVLIYTEKDGTNTSFDYKNNILRRDNDEMVIEFKFILGEVTKSKMSVKKLNGDLEIEVLTKELKVTDSIIKVVYVVNDLTFEYTLEKE